MPGLVVRRASFAAALVASGKSVAAARRVFAAAGRVGFLAAVSAGRGFFSLSAPAPLSPLFSLVCGVFGLAFCRFLCYPGCVGWGFLWLFCLWFLWFCWRVLWAGFCGRRPRPRRRRARRGAFGRCVRAVWVGASARRRVRLAAVAAVRVVGFGGVFRFARVLGVFMVALVGFCGSRCLPRVFAALVAGVVGAAVSARRGVAVGCAAGADAFALSAARRAGAPVSFFSVSSGAFGAGRAAFARRSVAFVAAVARSGSGSGLCAFVSSPCPSPLVPSASSSRCFAGFGSGSWASVALAVGLGVPVVVFPCVPAGVSAVSVLPSGWSGGWVAAGGGVWASGFRFVPSAP